MIGVEQTYHWVEALAGCSGALAAAELLACRDHLEPGGLLSTRIMRTDSPALFAGGWARAADLVLPPSRVVLMLAVRLAACALLLCPFIPAGAHAALDGVAAATALAFGRVGEASEDRIVSRGGTT
jgi:hypothetical protein